MATMRSKRARHSVAVAVTPGAPIFELAVPCEVFGIARPDIADPWYDFRLCAVEPDTVVAGGFRALNTGTMRELVTADTVIVPACQNVHDEPAAVLVEALCEAHASGARIVGICSGGFALAAAGLLDGRTATAHWMHATEFSARYPAITVDPNVLYVQDGGVFTSAGTAAGIDLCLELVRQDHGAAVANELARRLVVPPHRTGGQAQFVPVAIPDDPSNSLAPVLDWARQNLHLQIGLDELAGRAHVSRRTLVRRFHTAFAMSPIRWLQHERLRRAQQLLETTTMPVDHVAEATGHGTATTLRRAFAQHLTTTPSNYRRTFVHSGADPAE